MSKKKIIVTGATGYLGKAFANNFQKKYDIYCIVRKKSKLEELDSMRCSIIVYNEIEELYDIAKSWGYKIILHDPHGGYSWHIHLGGSHGKISDLHIQIGKAAWDYLKNLIG